MSLVSFNLQDIRANVAQAAKRAGRNPEEIKIIAVTKTIDIPRIQEAIDSGIVALGENKVQELVEKYPQIEAKVEWHLIGTLQRNKVKYIIDKVDLIHSVDSLSLAEEISKRAMKIDRVMPILIQINISGEKTKSGFAPGEAEDILKEMSLLSGVKVRGLMTMAPYFEDREEARYVFHGLKELRDKIITKNIDNIEMDMLSMGMSNDYEIAIEEGSTLIRVGSAIFGARKYN